MPRTSGSKGRVPSSLLLVCASGRDHHMHDGLKGLAVPEGIEARSVFWACQQYHVCGCVFTTSHGRALALGSDQTSKRSALFLCVVYGGPVPASPCDWLTYQVPLDVRAAMGYPTLLASVS